MKGLFLNILIGCTVYNLGIQSNSSLENKSMLASILPSYNSKDKALSPLRKFKTYTDYSGLGSKPTGVVGTKHNMENIASSTMYVFNNFPSEKELVRLEFIRKAMRVSLGEIKLCDTMTSDSYRVQSSPCSQGCSCDISCHETHDCCPDIQHKVINITILLNETEQYKVTKTKHIACKRLHLAFNEKTTQQAQTPMFQNHSFMYNNLKLAGDLHSSILTNKTAANLDQHGYLVISSCPTTFTDRTIINKCIGHDITLIQDMIPVVDKETAQLYKNKNCAICHAIVDALSWKLETDCIELYTNNCPIKKVKDLVQITQKDQCNIWFKPPKQTSKTAPQCRMEVNNVISSCNVTGLWTKLNQTILELCIEPDTIMHFYHKSGPQFVAYRNVFCYLCNQGSPLPTDDMQQCMKEFQQKSTDDSEQPTFKVVLDVKALESTNQNYASCTGTNSTYHVKNSLQSKDLPECELDQFRDPYMMKVANTLFCTIELLMNMFNTIATHTKVLPNNDELRAYNVSDLEAGIEYYKLPLKYLDFRHTVLTSAENSYKEISLRPLFNCPSIKLSVDDYNQLIKENVIEKLEDQKFKLQFSTKTQTVEICLQTYLHKYSQLENPNSHQYVSSSYETLQANVCLAATLISMISTIIVLITYSLFSELRFVPGKLFMILCFNLLLAQFFFSIGNNTGYSDLWCKIIGIGIHFFWLATFSAMSSSLLLMVQSIRCPMKQTNIALIWSKSFSTATKYILFAYAVPIIIVLISLFIGWMKDIPFGGYGGDFCYISTSSMRLYTFAVPILVLIISNFTMFTWIFCLTCHLGILPNKNHHYLIIFLKLSTITGVFWTFGFLYEATNLVYFGFLSTVFNAGQGFFLMWSFIFNKRVLNLYISLGKKHFYTLRG